MILNDLNLKARGLLAFHILCVEQQTTGDISHDTSIKYVKVRNQALADLNVEDSDIESAINSNGGQLILQDWCACLKAIQANLKGNTQRARVRNLLWTLADELEFDFFHGIIDTPFYAYKWDMVNQIITNKFFG